MSILSKIFSSGAEKIVGAVGDVLDKVTTTQDEKNKAEIAKMQLQIYIQQRLIELENEVEKTVQQDLENQRELIKLEMQNSDPYVRRARPSIIWVGLGIMIFNYVFLPLFQLIIGNTISPVKLPAEYWTVWGIYAGGYAYLRTREKTKGNGNGII